MSSQHQPPAPFISVGNIPTRIHLAFDGYIVIASHCTKSQITTSTLKYSNFVEIFFKTNLPSKRAQATLLPEEENKMAAFYFPHQVLILLFFPSTHPGLLSKSAKYSYVGPSYIHSFTLRPCFNCMDMSMLLSW